MINKEQVKQQYLSFLQLDWERAKIGHNTAKKDTIEAEGRMVTRYDSTKTEVAWLADGFQRELKEIEQCMADFAQQDQFINVGDSVYLEPIQDTPEHKVKSYEIHRRAMSEDCLLSLLGQKQNDICVVDFPQGKQECFIRKLEKHTICDDTLVKLYDLVSVVDADGFEDTYFLVKERGGMSLDIDGTEVFCISKETPIAKKMLGASVGDSIYIQISSTHEIEMKIISVL